MRRRRLSSLPSPPYRPALKTGPPRVTPAVYTTGLDGSDAETSTAPPLSTLPPGLSDWTGDLGCWADGDGSDCPSADTSTAPPLSTLPPGLSDWTGDLGCWADGDGSDCPTAETLRLLGCFEGAVQGNVAGCTIGGEDPAPVDPGPIECEWVTPSTAECTGTWSARSGRRAWWTCPTGAAVT